MTCLLLHIPDLDRFENAQAAWSVVSASGASTHRGNLSALAAHSASPIIALLPAARVTFIETALPPVTRHKRDALLRFAIEDKLTIDPNTVHAVVYDNVDRGAQVRAGGSRQYVVAAVDRAWFARVLAWLASEPLTIEVIAPVSVSIPVVDDEWQVVFGADGGGFAVRPDGFAFALDGDADQLSTPPFALAVALREAAGLARAPRRVCIAHHKLDAQRSAEISTSWQEALGVPIRFASVGSRTLDQATLTRAARAANLRVHEFASEGARSRWATASKPAWMLGLGAIALYLGAASSDLWMMNRERERMDQEMRTLFLGSFPSATAVVDAPLQMARNLDTLRLERGVAKTSQDPARASLTTASALLRGSGVAELPTAVSFSGDQLTLDFNAASPAAATALQSRLNASLDGVPSARVTVLQHRARLSLRAQEPVR